MINAESQALEYLAQKYNEANISLYLSYPTESFWKSVVEEKDFIESFKNVASPYFYFHFPYCKELCYYCCCYSSATKDESKKELYVQYIEKEFNLKLGILGMDKNTNISHMHWGGGTPTYLTCDQIERFFKAVSKKVNLITKPESSISIEAYPDADILTTEKLKLIKSLGFTEISFGIQDFDERIQKTINRNCKKTEVRNLIDKSKELGLRVHVDLCYGLPYQGVEEITRTLDEVIAMNPNRVVVYTYAHYPLAFPAQRLIPSSSIPNSYTKVLMAKAVDEKLIANGYARVGYDHYVKRDNPLYTAYKEGKSIRDFMGSSFEDRKNLLGFGNSSISFSGKMFSHNRLSIESYFKDIDEKRIPIEKNKGHILSKDDIIRQRVIQKYILCDFAINKKEINTEFGIDFDVYFKKEMEVMAEYEKNGLLENINSETVNLTENGKIFARHIAYAFDEYYNS